MSSKIKTGVNTILSLCFLATKKTTGFLWVWNTKKFLSLFKMGAAWLRSIRTLKDLKSENGDNENRRVIFSSCTEKWHDNNVRSVEEQVKDRHSRIIEPGEIVLWTTLIPPFVKDYFVRNLVLVLSENKHEVSLLHIVDGSLYVKTDIPSIQLLKIQELHFVPSLNAFIERSLI
jgi:hypothetical protein